MLLSLGYISREESERKLAQVKKEKEIEITKLGERVKKLSVLFGNIFCKLCESIPNLEPSDKEVWKYVNIEHLSNEDSRYIVGDRILTIFFES